MAPTLEPDVRSLRNQGSHQRRPPHHQHSSKPNSRHHGRIFYALYTLRNRVALPHARIHNCIIYAIICRITPYTCIVLLRIQEPPIYCIQHYCRLLLFPIMGWLQREAPSRYLKLSRNTSRPWRAWGIVPETGPCPNPGDGPGSVIERRSVTSCISRNDM
jgi:hypothetical protein